MLFSVNTLVATVTDNINFIIIMLLVVFFFSCHNYLQEFIMTFPGFHVGVFLGYLEVLGVTLCTGVERQIRNERPREQPWSAYGLLCVCLATSAGTGNLALNYINYPTKVIFRSCKLLPTMAVATYINGKRLQTYEYVAGVVVSIGMITFAFADFTVLPSFSLYGIALVLVSITADSFLPNLQEKYFSKGASRSEVTFFTNLLVLGGMTAVLGYSGDLQAAVGYALGNRGCMAAMTLYVFISHIAITCHMTLVQRYGGVAAVLVGNFRKALTIYLSFLLFPKPQSVWYLVGGLCVFGGLLAQEYTRELKKQQAAAAASGLGGREAAAEKWEKLSDSDREAAPLLDVEQQKQQHAAAAERKHNRGAADRRS